MHQFQRRGEENVKMLQLHVGKVFWVCWDNYDTVLELFLFFTFNSDH